MIIDKEAMLDLIVDAKMTDPETGMFAEWLAEYLVENLPTIPMPTEWVSVNERLPERNKNVLVYASWDGTWQTTIGRHSGITGGFWWVYTGHGYAMLYDVTHWMPLPEPPKEALKHEDD